MMCLQTRLVKRVSALAATAALATSAAACSAARAGDSRDVGVSQQAIDGPLATLAAACGLGCPGDEDDKGVEIKGIAEGNAAISGVASIDAFFASVINFQGAARGVAGGIKTQLDLIRGDFGIAADANLGTALETQFSTYLEGGVEIDVEPARCQADIDATLRAKARCEGELNPPKVMVECKGSCVVDASVEASCSADADLVCTFVPPDLMCSGQCQGSCEVELSGSVSCEGTCRGECSGECSAYVKNADGEVECAGRCSGMCSGSCETQLAAAAECEGSCKGECTVTNPSGGCDAAVRAECRAKGDASIMCDGQCTGDIEPPSGKVECKASAKAEAKINVVCTPPRATLAYRLRTGGNATARAKFEAALKTLVNTRIPALEAEIARGKSVQEAGAGLVSSAGGALEAAFEATASGDSSLRVKVGVICAADQLDEVGDVIEDSTAELKAQLDAAGSVMARLKS